MQHDHIETLLVERNELGRDVAALATELHQRGGNVGLKRRLVENLRAAVRNGDLAEQLGQQRRRRRAHERVEIAKVDGARERQQKLLSSFGTVSVRWSSSSAANVAMP